MAVLPILASKYLDENYDRKVLLSVPPKDVIDGEYSRALNMEKSFPVGELLTENAILELDSLTNTDKTFFIEALLLWIHHYRLSERSREIFKHAVILNYLPRCQ